MAIQISGTTVIDNSRNLVNVSIGEGTLISSFGPGSTIAGGKLLCKASSVAWIVAPSSGEVSRNWYSINDANTRAQQVFGCTGWFVPTCGQLQNPGYNCCAYWDSYSSTNYWSSTEIFGGNAWSVDFTSGGAGCGNKSNTRCVRAFRCVTY